MNDVPMRATTPAIRMRVPEVGVLIAATLLAWPGQAAPRDEASKDPSEAANFVFVEDGVSRAPIIVFEGAPPMTRRAADELGSRSRVSTIFDEKLVLVKEGVRGYQGGYGKTFHGRRGSTAD
ncbi:MAG: hypothetical protein J5I93_14760 [Pirellulaceae bacterium]|nr:hypothetical protein [Pirellulaceae bacterium]